MATVAGRKKSVISTTLQIDTPVAQNTLLNKSASQSTSLYQQCSVLRTTLMRIPGFVPWFALASPNGARQSTDPVTQIWDVFSLGVTLCYIFNLIEDEPPIATVETGIEDFDGTDRTKKRAIAQFAMRVGQIENCEPFTVTDLWDRNSTDGLVKVVNTIIFLVDRLPASAFESPPTSPSSSLAPSSSSDALTSDLSSTTTITAKESARHNIIREIVETERKYVQDLETMQKYSNALSQSNAMNQDTIHYLFPNLNKLLNFQRKFLIRLESTVELPWPDQRWGLHFIENEEEFSVYEPYCANYTAATELMLANEQNLMTMSHVIHAKSELPAFLIKPVQRICKYPLLLAQLVKACSPADYLHYDELKAGAEATKRITDKINEAQREAENKATVKSLINRIEDWKGHHLSNFGELLLDDIFIVTKSEVDREYHVFLFEKIILCCKDAAQLSNNNGRRTKSNSILKKQSTANGLSISGNAVQSKKRNTPLLLKGRIFLNNVTQTVPSSPRDSVVSGPSGNYSLTVWWRGDDDLEFFSLRCRNEEQMKQWETQINRLIKEVAIRRATDRGLAKIASQNSTSPSVMRQQLSVYSAGLTPTVPDSALPSTAHSSHWRLGPYNYEERTPIPPSSGLYSGPQGYPPHDGFEPDEDDFEDYPPASSSSYTSSGRVTPNSIYIPSGRGTPNGRRTNAQSLPPEHEHVPGYDRPRARTEDTNGPVMVQWRSNGLPPPLPPPNVPTGLPGSSIRPTTPHTVSTPNYHSDPSFVTGSGLPSRSLRSKYSSTKLQPTYDNGGRPHPNGGLPLQSRSRSVSQPNSYLPKTTAPPVPQSTPQPMHWGNSSAHNKRGSGSSQSTGESSDYSPNSSSPVTPFGSSESSLGIGRAQRTPRPFEVLSQNVNPHLHLSPPVKVKVHFHEDIFVIQVPRSTEYAELVEKVGRKIRLCGPRRDDGPLRVKYKDEDGDMVSLGSTEDVQMAFEQYRPGGQVTLFVT